MWRQHFKSMKGAPKLDMGTAVAPVGVAYTPTTALGWRDHFADQQKAKAEDGGKGVANAVAAHLTDDTDHQAQIAGAISNYLGAGGNT
jgi:hypothetical protein